VAGCCECGDEHSSSCATELVITHLQESNCRFFSKDINATHSYRNSVRNALDVVFYSRIVKYAVAIATL
jgi:hypothetical protein